MWNLKYDTNEPIYETNRIMDIKNRLVVANRDVWSGTLGLADVSFYIENG